MTLRVHPDIIVVAIGIGLALDKGIAIAQPVGGPAFVGLGLAILGVEIERAGRQRLRLAAIIDIVIEIADRLGAFIGHGDAGMLGEGHWEITVHRFHAAYRQHLRLPAVVGAETEAEEIANWGFHAWRGFAIPIDAQNYSLEMIRL